MVTDSYKFRAEYCSLNDNEASSSKILERTEYFL